MLHCRTVSIVSLVLSAMSRHTVISTNEKEEHGDLISQAEKPRSSFGAVLNARDDQVC
jgi:hypothetical protein